MDGWTKNRCFHDGFPNGVAQATDRLQRSKRRASGAGLRGVPGRQAARRLEDLARLSVQRGHRVEVRGRYTAGESYRLQGDVESPREAVVRARTVLIAQ